MITITITIIIMLIYLQLDISKTATYYTLGTILLNVSVQGNIILTILSISLITNSQMA